VWLAEGKNEERKVLLGVVVVTVTGAVTVLLLMRRCYVNLHS